METEVMSVEVRGAMLHKGRDAPPLVGAGRRSELQLRVRVGCGVRSGKVTECLFLIHR